VGVLSDGAWLRHAAHANAMARRLMDALSAIPQVRLAYPCQTNAAFVHLPRPVIESLWGLGWKFYTWNTPTECRLMCSWDTTPGDVDQFAADVTRLCRDPGAAKP
jgi:threonine aldolase